MLSVGAEASVTYWDVHPASGGPAGGGLDVSGRADSSIPLIFTALSARGRAADLDNNWDDDERRSGSMEDPAIDIPGGSVLCVGGAETFVECYTNPSSPSFTLSLLS